MAHDPWLCLGGVYGGALWAQSPFSPCPSHLRFLSPILLLSSLSDGAARNQGSGLSRQASSGSVRYRAGSRDVVAACGVYMGIASNNRAGYGGLPMFLERAVRYRWPRMRCHIDSLLLVKHVRYQWRYISAELRP